MINIVSTAYGVVALFSEVKLNKACAQSSFKVFHYSVSVSYTCSYGLFLVRSLVNLTLVSESLNKDRKYSGSFYQLEKKYDRSNTSQCKTQLFHFICLVFLFI